MAHDFKNFPELTNEQMEIYYFESPHKQITQNFRAKVVRVHDGDTVTLRTDFRDFDFPMRFITINAPELKETGGIESRDWLASQIEGEEVDIIIDPDQRVEKWGRLLGSVFFNGVAMEEESQRTGHSVLFEQRDEGKLPSIEKIIGASALK